MEVYPDHEDFAVRTLGMPGLGALGVTFGTVVAMDSPSGRPPGNVSLGEHAVARIEPRVRAHGDESPGSALVYRRYGGARRDCYFARLGRSSGSDGNQRDQDKKLLPVAQLDRGFIRPTYPNQVIVSYFQAGRICDFINEKWGYQKLLDMMHAFAQSKQTAEVIQRHSLKMKPEEFDTSFWPGSIHR